MRETATTIEMFRSASTLFGANDGTSLLGSAEILLTKCRWKEDEIRVEDVVVRILSSWKGRKEIGMVK